MEEIADITDKSDDEYNSDTNAPNIDANPAQNVTEQISDAESDADSNIESDVETIDDLEIDIEDIPEEGGDDIIDVLPEGISQSQGDNINIGVQDENDEEDDSMSDTYEDYLQKIDKQFRNNILEEYHSEEFHINPDEMSKLCQIKKNNKGFIDDPLHKTTPIMSKYEYTNLIGVRSKQLGNGAPALIDIPDGVIENFIIAEIELKQKVLPFVVKRPLGNGGCEYWRISDLEILL
tara:strand:+ start:1545 stop:2249 length:705 start_codon:yes stop_codon:yes gene_type:complete